MVFLFCHRLQHVWLTQTYFIFILVSLALVAAGLFPIVKLTSPPPTTGMNSQENKTRVPEL